MRCGKWEAIRELGHGGQGVAYLALDTAALNLPSVLEELRRAVGGLAASGSAEDNKRNALAALGIIEKYLERESEKYCAVLKVLHEPARKDEKALERLRNEVAVLGRLSHRNLIGVIDSSAPEGWFVTPFYREGALARHLGRFAGRPEEALEALRGLVAGVEALHKVGVVHRDIKPENIFVSDAGLMLGDFGIVYFEDEARTRVSDRYENVGSRDWMPGWAMGIRVDDVRPSFDVFSLGKVLWAMVSGRTKMRLWYFDHPDFNLETQFPTDEQMRWINRLLMGSVREHEEHVWNSAGVLLEQVDQILLIMRRRGQVMRREVARRCDVCGVGDYRLIINERSGPDTLRNFGLNPAGEAFRMFECTNCGNVQIFRVTHMPPGWDEVVR